MHRIFLLMTAATLAFAEGGPTPAGPTPGAPSGPGSPGDAAPAAAQGGGWMMIAFIVVMIGMMWFMVIRPQRKEEKRRKQLIEAIKRGDEVVTIGGVHGTVDAVGEATIDVRIGKGNDTVVATFNKGAVSTNLTAERAPKKD
jgi:preprotein translocase subunit YajC